MAGTSGLWNSDILEIKTLDAAFEQPSELVLLHVLMITPAIYNCNTIDSRIWLAYIASNQGRDGVHQVAAS